MVMLDNVVICVVKGDVVCSENCSWPKKCFEHWELGGGG